MEGAGLFRVDNVPFMEEIMVSELLVSHAKQTKRHKSEYSGAEGQAHRQVESTGFEVE